MAKLVKGVVYALTVEALTKLKGPIKDMFFHHFTFYDSRTQVYKAEYKTTDQFQKHFLPGAKAYFYVSEVEQYAEMIEPMPEGYTQKEDYRDMTETEKARFYSQPPVATSYQEPRSMNQLPVQRNIIAGTPHSIAMGLAANLYGSLTGCAGMTEYSKEKLFEMADDIEEWLLKKQAKMEGGL